MFGFLFRRKNGEKVSGGSGSRKHKDILSSSLEISDPSISNSPDSSAPCHSQVQRPHDTFPVGLLEPEDCPVDEDVKRTSIIDSSSDEIYSAALPFQPPAALPPLLNSTIDFIDTDDDEVDNGGGLEWKIPPEHLLTEGDQRFSNTSEFDTKDKRICLLESELKMLSRDRENKTIEIEGLTSQVKKLREENENSTIAAARSENQLEELRQKNNELFQELREKTDSLRTLQRDFNSNESRILEFLDRIRDLERELRVLKKEEADLIAEHDAIEIERDEEMRALQNGLDRELELRIQIQNKFEQDFKSLRNSFSAQEQQLMDDFEWKLRQIECTCKTKLREKDLETEEKLKDVRNLLERDFIGEKEKLIQERRAVDEQMRLVCHYKAYEPELIQLRGLTHEQQRALRSAARQLEHFKFNEKILHDDIRSARTLLEKEKSHVQAIQSNNQRRMEVQDENLHSKLEEQKNDLNSKWEDRMRAECNRLKQDLCKLHAEEKHLAIESAKLQKEQEFTAAKQAWAKQRQDFQENISKLKDAITEKESATHREVEEIAALADRENWELRKKLKRVTASNEEYLDKIREAHAKEIDSLQAKYEASVKQIRDLEQKVTEYDENRKKGNLKSMNGDIECRQLTPMSTCSPVNQSDSGCGDEESSDESEEDGDDIEVDDQHKDSPDVPEGNDDEEVAAVDHLRKEVATLQGSIKKLTTELGGQGGNDVEVSSSESESDNEDSEECN